MLCKYDDKVCGNHTVKQKMRMETNKDMEKRYLTSGEFAKLCDTTKVTLRHYKDIGILKPRYEGENHYSYYDVEQFYDYYAIEILKKTGTSLAKIKECMVHQDIPQVVEVLRNQQLKLAEQQQKLEQMMFVVKNSLLNIEMGSDHAFDHLVPQIRYFPKEHLLAMTESDFEMEKEEQADENRTLIAILGKYKEICEVQHIQTDYQLGAILPYEGLGQEKPTITHIYTKVNKFYKSPYYREKPAGHYLCVLHRGNWDAGVAYKKLVDAIQEQHIQVSGDVYAYDLAGFMINGVEENAMTIISVLIK